MAKNSKPKDAKPLPQQWLEKIQRALQVKKYWKEKFKVELAYEYYEGNQRPAHIDIKEWITINKLFSGLQAELPSLYSQDPEFYVKLKRSFSPNPMDVALFDQKGKVRQAMLNYLKEEIDLKPKSRLSIFDAFFQFGIVKLSHLNDWVENPDAGKPILEGEVAALDGEGNPLIEPKQLPTNERYIIERIHPDDFIVDEDAGPLSYNWCAHKNRAKLDDLKKDKRFNAAARGKVTATELSAEDAEREKRKKGNKQASTVTSQDSPDPNIVVYWEIWDNKNKQLLVVSDGCNDEFLIDPGPLPPGIECDPFVDLRFIFRDDSWYPYPPLSPKLDPQREYCETRSKILTHRKRFNRKYILFASGFDDAEAAASKLEAGEDGTVLIAQTPGEHVYPIKDAPLDMQVHTELVYLDRDFDEFGAGANQRGSGTGIDSATEAGIVETKYKVKEGDKKSIVADFLARIAKKLDFLVQANLTKEYAVQVQGPEGASWELIRPTDYQDIFGEYTHGVVMGSHTPQLPEIERAQGLNFLSLISQTPQLAMSPALMRLMGRWFQIEENQLNLMIQELQQMVKMMAAGQLPPPGGQGSMPGVAEGSRVQSAGPGMALGINNMRGGQQ